MNTKVLTIPTVDNSNTAGPKVLSQAAYYALGIVIMKGISLLMIPYITRQLSPVEYGSLEILLLIADVCTIVIGFGLVEALNRFVGLAGDNKNESNVLIANCFSIAVMVSLLSMMLLVLFASSIINNLPAKITNLQFVLIIFPALLEGLIAIPLTLMRMQSLARRFFFLNIAKAIFQAVIVIILLEMGYGITAILIAGAVSSLFLVIFLMPYQWQQMAKKWHWRKTFEILRYGAPIVIGRLGLFAMTGLDRWMLADKVGIEQLAVYAIAVKFALIMSFLMQPFTLWWFPYRFKLLKQQGGKEQCAYYAMLGTNLGLLLGFAMMLTAPQFIQLILPSSYHEAAQIIIALLVVNMIKNAGDLLNLGCFINSSLNQMWVQWLCAVLAVIGYVSFIEDYGVWAAAGVLIVVYLLRLSLFYRYSQSLYPLPYAHKNWLLVITVGIVCYGLLYCAIQIPYFESNMLLQFILGSGLAVLLLVILIANKVFPNPIKYWQQYQANKVSQ
jgi:O-antigen/teichoic acid export membrane protein